MMKNILKIYIDRLPKDINVHHLLILYSKYHKKEHDATPYDLSLMQVSKYIKITDYDTFDFELRSKAYELLDTDIISIGENNIAENENVKENIKEDSFEWVNDYRKLFKLTRASGKLGDKNATLKKMQWFFKEYPEYANKELIMTATRKYIDQEAHNNYKYLQRADYFISKEDGSKIKMSRLASFCEEIDDIDQVSEDYDHSDERL